MLTNESYTDDSQLNIYVYEQLYLTLIICSSMSHSFKVYIREQNLEAPILHSIARLQLETASQSNTSKRQV